MQTPCWQGLFEAPESIETRIEPDCRKVDDSKRQVTYCLMRFGHERQRFLHDVRRNVRGVAGESAMPAVSSRKNRVQSERGGPMPCPMQPDEGPLLPSCVRLVHRARDISAPAHESHQAAAHPPHLVTSTSDSPPLVASSFCIHAKQARGRFAVTCTFQTCL